MAIIDLEALTGGKKTADTANAGAILFYQSEECRQMLEEAMLYQGMAAPVCKPCTDAGVIEEVSGIECPLILIEVTGDIVELGQKLRPLVSRHVRVILVGQEDSITTMRAVGGLGFYYILWPSEKQDIVGFLRKLQGDQVHDKGPQVMRSAKRVAVMAAKGGSGCTLVTSELAYALSRETQQELIVVDHGYNGSSMHIMLGKKDLTRSSITELGQKHHTLGQSLDHVNAQSQLTKVDKNIHYLGLEAESGTGEDLREYTHEVLDTLRQDANFIVEDYSASAKFYPKAEWLCPMVDCLTLVIQPTLSSLHETKIFLDSFKKVNEQIKDPARILLVLNHCHPMDSIEKKSIEQYLQLPIDIELPYFKKCEEFLVSGKRFIDGKNALQKPFSNMARMILGKPLISNKFSLFSFGKGESKPKKPGKSTGKKQRKMRKVKSAVTG